MAGKADKKGMEKNPSWTAELPPFEISNCCSELKKSFK